MQECGKKVGFCGGRKAVSKDLARATEGRCDVVQSIDPRGWICKGDVNECG